MYQQLYQTEKYHLVTLQQDLKHELEQIGRVRRLEASLMKSSMLCRILAATGSRMIRIGSQLVERYDTSRADHQPQPTGRQAAGMV